MHLNFDFKSEKTIRMRAVTVDESQFIKCLEDNLWRSNNSNFKNWYIGDYIIFIVNKELVALAKVMGEQYKLEDSEWNNRELAFSIPITFIKVLSRKNSLPIENDIKKLIQGDWDDYRTPIRHKLLLPNYSSEKLLSLFKSKPDSKNTALNDIKKSKNSTNNTIFTDSLEIDNDNLNEKEDEYNKFHKIEINEWRQFEKIDIKFHKRMTILTGANGSGKTTLLNLLNSHFGWVSKYISNFETDEDSLKLKYTSGIWGSSRNTLSIGKIIYSNKEECVLSIPDDVSQTYEIKMNNINSLKGLYIPSHRPVYRFEEIKSIPTRIRPIEEIFNEYSHTVKNDYLSIYSERSPIFILKESLLSMAFFGFGNEVISQNIFALDLFREFESILKKVLPPRLGFLDLSIQMPEVILNTESGNFSLDGVSGGMASLIDMTWLIFLYNRLGDNFIVTIDEPENHLHPEMQKLILPNLIEAFPNIQFIVVTHNPFIIGSVPDSYVYALNYNENKKVYSILLDMVSKAGSSNEILRDVLGLPFTMPLWVEDKLNKIVESYHQLEFNDELIKKLSHEMETIGLQQYIPLAISNIYKKEE
ncbi:AAA family ATPase [Priestia megaterium]|uniref:AAA family ATPase n=1 Tax=Priestia megaterium TaxID=1404 RepID=UPI0035585388